jgi:hypothetical protein
LRLFHVKTFSLMPNCRVMSNLFDDNSTAQTNPAKPATVPLMGMNSE